MLSKSLKIALIGGAAMLAAPVAAQQAVPTPEGNTVIVPDAALEAESSIAPEAIGYATLTSFDSDQAVAETLIAQGFTNLVINRTGPTMTVTGTRDGVPTELVYSLANGRLMSVDGVDFPHPADAAAAAEAGSGSVTNAAPGSVSVGDDGTTDGDDTTDGADDGADDGAGNGAGEGADDAGGDDGSDDGADGEGEGSGDSDGEGDSNG